MGEADAATSKHPTVGQRVYLAGTGQWWAGQQFSAIVVDVRQSDDTVKVRYSDGGFKRFKLQEFQSLASVADNVAALDSWQVGQHVYLTGIGQWWSGQTFGATVVDVRKSDATVKVRYTDGGFKRFKVEEFGTLVTEQQAAPAMWEEWDASSQTGPVSDLRRLHDGVMLATRKGDLEQASELKEKFAALAAKEDEIRAMRSTLVEAVNRGDYLEAHRVKQLILERSDSPTLVTPPPLPEQGSPSALAQVLQQSVDRALTGGIAGAGAMVLQIGSLMWLRTTMNYQYRYGLSTPTALRVLYAEGGVARFYRGLGPALLQGPLLRFGDTAANAGVLAFFDGTDARHWPTWVKTIFASTLAATGRIAFLPVDTLKIVMQVEGKKGVPILLAKLSGRGPRVLFHGGVASSAATFVSHYPWFVVFNTLNEKIPNYDQRPQQLLRNAGIGFCASVCSDTVSNSLRVMKTYRQAGDIGYRAIVETVIRNDGVSGFLLRGLTTRIIANGFSGVAFSVLYKMFEEKLVR